MNWLTSYLVIGWLTMQDITSFLTSVLIGQPRTHQEGQNICHCMSFLATLQLTMQARSFSSSHVLFGQHCTHQSGHYVSKNILSFWSTRVLTNKDIFCKGVIVLVRHHWLNRGRQLKKYLNKSIPNVVMGVFRHVESKSSDMYGFSLFQIPNSP